MRCSLERIHSSRLGFGGHRSSFYGSWRPRRSVSPRSRKTDGHRADCRRARGRRGLYGGRLREGERKIRRGSLHRGAWLHQYGDGGRDRADRWLARASAERRGQHAGRRARHVSGREPQTIDDVTIMKPIVRYSSSIDNRRTCRIFSNTQCCSFEPGRPGRCISHCPLTAKPTKSR